MTDHPDGYSRKYYYKCYKPGCDEPSPCAHCLECDKHHSCRYPHYPVKKDAPKAKKVAAKSRRERGGLLGCSEKGEET